MVSTLDRDDQLRNNRQDLVAAFIQQIIGAQNSEGTIGIEFLSSTIKEDGKVVVIVQWFNWNFPDKLGKRVLVVDSDG